MTTPPKVTKTPGYTQTKIRFCQTDPFRALDAMGMWYSYCLQSEIEKWQTDSRTARLRADATDKVAFTIHPQSYNLRRILTDGQLLKVYNSKGELRENTLLPIAVPGANIKVLELDEVVPFLKGHGAFYCRFAIDGLSHTGYVLPAKEHWAAWSDKNVGMFWKNAQVVEKLPEPQVTPA